MSRSSLFVIDKNFSGMETEEYGNSWWFSPIVWDVLLDKYMRNDIMTPFGFKKSIIMNGNELVPKLNDIINNTEKFYDRICWELSNQQVFFTKDKEIIAQGIRDFLANNTAYHIHKEEGKSVLTFKHIAERFNQIADDILAIDENEYPHFVFKNTSVDDNVEYWFYGYDEETDDSVNKTLKDWDKVVAEFVIIKDGQISFKNNLRFFEGDQQ